MASEDKKSKREHIIHFEDTPSKSLDEVNGSVEVPHNAGFWKTLAAYTGPGILVAVGYMDPGNWITSIAGGASFCHSYFQFDCDAAASHGGSSWHCDRQRFSADDT